MSEAKVLSESRLASHLEVVTSHDKEDIRLRSREHIELHIAELNEQLAAASERNEALDRENWALMVELINHTTVEQKVAALARVEAARGAPCENEQLRSQIEVTEEGARILRNQLEEANRKLSEYRTVENRAKGAERRAERLQEELTAANERADRLAIERDEWAQAIRSVASGCIPSPVAAETAIRELKEMLDKKASQLAERDRELAEASLDSSLLDWFESRRVLIDWEEDYTSKSGISWDLEWGTPANVAGGPTLRDALRVGKRIDAARESGEGAD